MVLRVEYRRCLSVNLMIGVQESSCEEVALARVLRTIPHRLAAFVPLREQRVSIYLVANLPRQIKKAKGTFSVELILIVANKEFAETSATYPLGLPLWLASEAPCLADKEVSMLPWPILSESCRTRVFYQLSSVALSW